MRATNLGFDHDGALLSGDARAAIKIAVSLARHFRRLTVTQIASQSGVGLEQTEFVLARLKSCGLIHQAGAVYDLSLSYRSITIAQIIRAMDGSGDAPAGDGILDGQHMVERDHAVEHFEQRLQETACAILENYSLAEAITPL